MILAGIVFGTLLGDNGLLKITGEAANKWRDAEANDQAKLEEIKNEAGKWKNETDTTFGTNGNTTPGVSKVNEAEPRGMEPVYWAKDSSGDIDTVNPQNNTYEINYDSLNFKMENWYSYIEGDNSTDSKSSMWANAKTADGSYWVWIPRYAYRITEKPANADPQKGKGKIEVVFLKGTTNQYDDNGTMRDAVGDGYTVHPAFTFGTKQLTGFWTGKYESSSVEGNADTKIGDNVTTKTIQIKPNVQSWRYIDVSTIFENCYVMASNSIYEFVGVQNGDTHMMKNVEWGAVAYLTHSQYGRNRNEITINNSSTYITGSAGNSVSAAADIGTMPYDTLGGQLASTTGNIYGVYDMSGGSVEYVAGNLTGFIGNAGIIGNFDIIYNNVDEALKNKFFDFYVSSTEVVGSDVERTPNYNLNLSKLGDATVETSTGAHYATSWFGDCSYFIFSNHPWMLRGGISNGVNSTTRAGMFSFHGDDGRVRDYTGFRVVLCI